MKKKNIKVLVLTILTIILFACQKEPKLPSYLSQYAYEFKNSPRSANLTWFKDAKFGMFIHYGLYALLEKGEWIQLRDTIPVAEYAKLKDKFSAEKFNPKEIVHLAKSARMKYITITSKHHDGFCLFETKETEFNVMNSPAKRDLIKELYEECQKQGIGLFLYYSYAADWKHPYFYAREDGWANARPAYKAPQEEYKYEDVKDFKKYVNFVHAQVTELLTQYPDIAGIWFDPIMGFYNRPDLFPIDSTYSLIRRLSPHALISFKQGANGDEDFTAPERGGKAKVGQQFEIARVVYEKNKDKPKEICNTLQAHSWGYKKADNGKHKTVAQVLKMLTDADSINANLLLNIGPLGDGSIPNEDRETLLKVGEIIKNKE